MTFYKLTGMYVKDHRTHTIEGELEIVPTNLRNEQVLRGIINNVPPTALHSTVIGAVRVCDDGMQLSLYSLPRESRLKDILYATTKPSNGITGKYTGQWGEVLEEKLTPDDYEIALATIFADSEDLERCKRAANNTPATITLEEIVR